MAFTEAEKVDIVTITGVDIIRLNNALDTYETWITSDVETQVREELTRWETDGFEFVSIEPRESNKGVRLNSSLAKQDIRKHIADLLFLNECMASGLVRR